MLSIFMFILGIVFTVFGIIGMVRKQKYCSVLFGVGMFLIGFFGTFLGIQAGYISWWI